MIITSSRSRLKHLEPRFGRVAGMEKANWSQNPMIVSYKGILLKAIIGQPPWFPQSPKKAAPHTSCSSFLIHGGWDRNPPRWSVLPCVMCKIARVCKIVPCKSVHSEYLQRPLSSALGERFLFVLHACFSPLLILRPHGADGGGGSLQMWPRYLARGALAKLDLH